MSVLRGDKGSAGQAGTRHRSGRQTRTRARSRVWAKSRAPAAPRVRVVPGAALIAALAAAVLLLGLGTGAQAQTFTDVDPTDWFYAPVEALGSQGVVGGYADGTFRPYEPVTRAEFASWMATLLGIPPTYDGAFSDVSQSDRYAGAVGALRERGIVQGSAGGVFRPDAELSRQQAASLVMRAYAYAAGGDARGGTEAGTGGGISGGAALLTDETQIALWLQGFKDRAAIAPDHRAAVANAYRLGVVSGFDDSRFYPFMTLTRAQAAGVLYAALGSAPAVRLDPAPPVDAEAGYPAAGEGDAGPLVAWVEHRLAQLSYDPGPTDGVFDARTAEAVMAFQKVEGLERSAVATAGVWNELATAVRPSPRRQARGDRVEIDLTRQVLFFINDDVVQRTVPIASGRSGWRTPTGTFSIQRKLPYWRESHLGMLYKPAYFYGGYAVHGSYSVPPYPASHGCVRVSVETMDILYPLLPVGTRVDVYY